ncbi:hypothetical protein GCM10023186_05150 [Hymenobacter koreensis]|uniref:Lipocalin-like domain-containing protein n=1 Tax=Hymenobacter koreensis TaxID=1084523 RepID=A0ABP8IVL7_9BACT
MLLTISCQRPATTAKPLAPASLTGTWTATGYTCGGPTPPQLVRVVQQGTLAKATKLRGDDCVGENEPTWEAIYLGRSPFQARLFNRMGENPATVRVLGPDKLEMRDGTEQVIVFVRQPAPVSAAPTTTPAPAPKTPAKAAPSPSSKKPKS